MTLKTFVSEVEEKDFAEFLHQQIKEFNNRNSARHKQVRAPDAVKPLHLILKDGSGEIVGGLTASTYWEWLDIDDFYIPAAYRGQRLGTSLLQQAEAMAVNRGCKRACLTTFQFQARIFYEKQGYYVTGKLEDYPPGSIYYWMRKDLG